MHGDVSDVAKRLELIDREGLLFLDQTANLQAVVLETALTHFNPLLGLLACRRTSVHPVERRNIVFGEGACLDLTRVHLVEGERTNGLGCSPDQTLCAALIFQ